MKRAGFCLWNQGIYQQDNLLGPELAAKMRSEVEQLRGLDLFDPARLVKDDREVMLKGIIEKDLGPSDWNDAPQNLLFVDSSVSGFPAALNQLIPGLALSPSRYMSKLSVYQSGKFAFQDSHFDNQCDASDLRKVTIVYFSNPGYKPSNGGHWRLQSHLNQSEKSEDDKVPPHEWIVEPKDDRILIFWSDLISHEVLPCYGDSDLAALTVWLTTEDPGIIGRDLNTKDERTVFKFDEFEDADE